MRKPIGLKRDVCNNNARERENHLENTHTDTENAEEHVKRKREGDEFFIIRLDET